MNNLRRRRKKYSGRRRRRQPGRYSRDEIYSFSRETRSFFSGRDPGSRGEEESLADRRCIQSLVLCALCQQGLRPCWKRRRRKRISVPYVAFKLTLLSPQMKAGQWDFICIRLLQRGGTWWASAKRMESRHGVHTHAHRALREDARLSFSQPAGGTCDPPPMRRGALARWGGGGELRFRGRVWVLFGVGLCCGGEGRGMLREKCSGDGGDFDEWTPAMTLF